MKNNSILITTEPSDIHAACVMLAIRELGHKADILLMGDIPERARLSMDLTGGDLKTTVVEHLSGSNYLADYSTLWCRRRPSSKISRDRIHPADIDMAINESKEHVKAFYCLAERVLVCVNGFRETAYAEIKLNQIHCAAKVGFRFPRTLLSNDPDRIRGFMSSLPDGSRAIYKPYQSPIWQSGTSVAFGYTSVVGPNDLPIDSVLQLTPGIFQEYIEKKYELRIIWMGGRAIAVRIDSQDIPDAQIDWRAAQNNPDIKLTEVSLPHEVMTRCARLMNDLSLWFGCIDMIFAENGEYVFLEVNSMGQFLWIESINPEIQLLDAFVQFILDPQKFSNRYEKFGLNFGEYAQEAQAFLLSLQGARQDQLASTFVHNE